MEQFAAVVIGCIVTGALSSFATIAAMNVHISYLKEYLKDHDQRLLRLEER